MERGIMQSEANKIGDKIDKIIEKKPDMEYSKKVNDLRNLQIFILQTMTGNRKPLKNKENEEELQRKSTKIIKKAKAKSRKASMKGGKGKRTRSRKGKRTRKN
jgi:hypothetical protein